MKDSCNVLNVEVKVFNDEDKETRYKNYLKKYAEKHNISEEEASTHVMVKRYYATLNGE